ncbi:MAG: hypothetical protein AAF628_22575 [Planctomycetota bacterium]
MRVALAFVTAASTGLALWLALTADPRTPPTPSAGNELAAGESAKPDEAPPAARPTAAPQPTDAANERVALDSGVPQLTVRVVRHGSKQPVADAEVGFLAHGEVDWAKLDKAEALAASRRELSFYRARGNVRTTNAAGECLVPMAAKGMLITGRRGTLFGTVRLGQPQDEPLLLTLRPDHNLLVRVHEATGKPAVGLNVIMTKLEQQVTKRLGETDETGTTEDVHTQLYAEDAASCFVKLHAEGHGIRSSSVEVDLLHAPAVTVDLQLPPTGTITFQLVNDAGEAYRLGDLHPPRLTLSMHEQLPTGRTTRQSGSNPTFDQQGRAVVAHIALDQFYMARALPLVRAPITGPGPTSQQPELTVKVPVSAELVIFRGRALDAEGHPLSGKSLQLRAKYDRGESSLRGQINDTGTFALPFPHLDPGKEVHLSLQATAPRDHNAVPATLSLTEPWTVHPGANDLGELQLREAPVLLSGTLVVPKALASLQRIYWQCQEADGHGWESRHDVRTRWLEGRRFEVRGEATGDRPLRLSFGAGKYQPLAPLEFTPGTKDVQIRLTTGNEVRASMLVEQAGLAQRLRASLRPMHPEPEAPAPRNRFLEIGDYVLREAPPDRLQAHWTGLASGRYRFTIECLGAVEPIVEVSDILVEAGAAQDPRLIDIDLRSRLRFVNIRVEDPSGAAATGQDAQIYVSDAAGENWHRQLFREGVARILIADRADLRVLVPGHRFAHVRDVAEDRIIRLDVLPKLKVRIEWPFALPPELRPQLQLIPSIPGTTRHTRVHYENGSSAIANRTRSEAWIDRRGTAVAQPAFVGEHKLRIALAPGAGGHYLYAITPPTIDVLDTTQPEITLEVDAEGLRRSLERMENQ